MSNYRELVWAIWLIELSKQIDDRRAVMDTRTARRRRERDMRWQSSVVLRCNAHSAGGIELSKVVLRFGVTW